MPGMKISLKDVLAKVGSLTIECDLLRQQLAESRQQLVQATHPALHGSDNGQEDQGEREFSGRLADSGELPDVQD